MYLRKSVAGNRSKNRTTFTEVPLVPCTREHFSFNEQTLQAYDEVSGEWWKCPPMNHSFTLQGRFLSSYQQYLTLKIKKCNTTLHSNCAPDGRMAAIQARLGGKFRGLTLIMGNNINPNNAVYREPYLETRNDFSFTVDNTAVEADIYVEEAIVSTDHSLLPIADIRKDRVLSVEEFAAGESVGIT